MALRKKFQLSPKMTLKSDSLLNSLKDILTGGLADQLTVVPLEAYQRRNAIFTSRVGGCFADISLYSILASATLSATPHSALCVYNLK